MSKQVIVFHYELKGDKGDTIDSSRGSEPMAFLESSEQIIPGLEEVLLGLKKGEQKEVTIPYQDAYGAYDQALVAKIPRSQFPPEALKVGDVFQIEKDGAFRLITIVDLTDENVTVDSNHPMAGKNLNFWVELVDRRDATPEEIAHGHVHGAGGHHH